MAQIIDLQGYRESLEALAKRDTQEVLPLAIDVPVDKINRLLTQLTIAEALVVSIRMRKGANNESTS